jgi:hypothetical protein
MQPVIETMYEAFRCEKDGDLGSEGIRLVKKMSTTLGNIFPLVKLGSVALIILVGLVIAIIRWHATNIRAAW